MGNQLGEEESIWSFTAWWAEVEAGILAMRLEFHSLVG